MDDLAKKNPTFEEISTTLNNCDDLYLFSSMSIDPYNVIDDDDLLLGDDDLLPVTNNSDKSYTQVCFVFVFVFIFPITYNFLI